MALNPVARHVCQHDSATVRLANALEHTLLMVLGEDQGPSAYLLVVPEPTVQARERGILLDRAHPQPHKVSASLQRHDRIPASRRPPRRL